MMKILTLNTNQSQHSCVGIGCFQKVKSVGPGCSGLFRLFWVVPGCFMSFRVVLAECSGLFWVAPGCYRLFQVVPGCSGCGTTRNRMEQRGTQFKAIRQVLRGLLTICQCFWAKIDVQMITMSA